MNSKLAIRLTVIPWCFGLLLALDILGYSDSLSQAPTRGQGVKIAVGRGESIDLYDGSYALVIGASEYQKWRKLPGVQRDVDEVAAVLHKHGFKIEKLL